MANQNIYKLWKAYLIFDEWFIGPVDGSHVSRANLCLDFLPI